MNVAFLIGNGFDINIGINIWYTDFYPYYLPKEHNDIISKANVSIILSRVKNLKKMNIPFQRSKGMYLFYAV